MVMPSLLGRKFNLYLMKNYILIALFILSSLTFSGCKKQSETNPPNVILILIDDMGWKDFGEAGSTYYETPNIDQLSRDGIRFTKGYSSAPVCSPSRGALLTGRYPARTKLTTVWNQGDFPIDREAKLHSTAKQGEKNWRQKFNYRFEEGRHYHTLPLSETTFADVLSESGYHTGYLGKWHCGWDEKFWPDKRGFEYAEGYRINNIRTPHFGESAIGNVAGMEDMKPDDYVGDKLTDKAVDFIRINADGEKPFMLMLSHYLVHGPIEGKEEYVPHHENKPTTDQENPKFASMIQSVDESVGRVVQAVEDAGISENTMIIFTSDNGGLVPVSSCYPLLGGKSFLFEAGMRVPFIIRWEGEITPSVDEEHRIMHPDIFPTLLDIAGVEQMPDLHQDGSSFYPLLMNDSEWTQKPLFFHFPHFTHATSPGTVLIDGDWKMIRFYNSPDDEQYMLFNLFDDPYEQNDLADSNRDKLKEMVLLMQKYLEDTGCELPQPNPNFDAAKPFQLDKDHYYNFANKQRNEREKKLK